MVKKSLTLYPNQTTQMVALGERIRLARLRRKLTTSLFAERMGVSRETLRRVENGDPTVAFGSYLSALQTLGLANDIDHLANEDVLGRKLQDASLATKSKRNSISSTLKLPRKTGVTENTFQVNAPSLINQVMAKYKNKPPSDKQG
ncbi:helix-turn-helix domain-containing protein [Undibacterium flavidum]|uniref:Helix-turn-helix domain-containing protein n=1 Tax=Undibacterium flavidum TaxID=2762297 RepID=A0ABR6Y9C2_9BURK|nr:helix-turn-helix domain-containing protein [Undibacterium flavidum]MBC3873167.1 helix-turn-helix domain-containing protein [Undibacterium flavidum]